MNKYLNSNDKKETMKKLNFNIQYTQERKRDKQANSWFRYFDEMLTHFITSSLKTKSAKQKTKTTIIEYQTN